MYIEYELYRSKNNELFDRASIEVQIRDDKDLIAIDDIISGVLKYHIRQLPIIQKYGEAYVGRARLVSIVVNDNDYVSDLNEEAFNLYIHQIEPNIVVKWNRK